MLFLKFNKYFNNVYKPKLFWNYNIFKSSSTRSVIKYTDTIHLSKTKLPLRLNTAKRHEIEKRILDVNKCNLYYLLL